MCWYYVEMRYSLGRKYSHHPENGYIYYCRHWLKYVLEQGLLVMLEINVKFDLEKYSENVTFVQLYNEKQPLFCFYFVQDLSIKKQNVL